MCLAPHAMKLLPQTREAIALRCHPSWGPVVSEPQARESEMEDSVRVGARWGSDLAEWSPVADTRRPPLKNGKTGDDSAKMAALLVRRARL